MRDPGNHENQFIYLQGPWTNDYEHLRHARATRNHEDYIALRFFATTVNAVVDPGDADPFEVQVDHRRPSVAALGSWVPTWWWTTDAAISELTKPVCTRWWPWRSSVTTS